jgi:hypothetical protein
MQVDLSTMFAIAVPSVAAIVWLVRLEGRINVTDARYTEILSRLTRIESKQDSQQS